MCTFREFVALRGFLTLITLELSRSDKSAEVLTFLLTQCFALHTCCRIALSLKPTVSTYRFIKFVNRAQYFGMCRRSYIAFHQALFPSVSNEAIVLKMLIELQGRLIPIVLFNLSQAIDKFYNR